MPKLWKDVLEMPESLQATLDTADGFAAVAETLRRPDVRRIVATGNGAAYYVAHALWLVSLETAAGTPVIAVPAGLIAADRFAWRPGDILLVISSSGELRDLVELIRGGALPVPYVAISSTAASTIATHSAACAIVQVRSQRAVTHTQAYCGNLVAALAIWAALAGDRPLRDALARIPERCAQAVETADQAIGTMPSTPPAAAVAFGAGLGWSAALETALLLKEVAQLPAEGQEAREGATSGMTGLDDDSLVVSIRTGSALELEAERQCSDRGSRVVVIHTDGDARLAPIVSFPASVALAIALGQHKGVDVDAPAWTSAYFQTARTTSDAAADGR